MNILLNNDDFNKLKGKISSIKKTAIRIDELNKFSNLLKSSDLNEIKWETESSNALLPDFLRIETFDSKIDKKSKNLLFMDIASVIVVRIMELQPTDVLLDLCAAPGSKSIISNFLVKEHVAVDVNEKRLNIMRNLLKKYERIQSIILLKADAVNFDPKNKNTFELHFSRVRKKKSELKKNINLDIPTAYTKILVDVECTHDGSFKHLIKFDSLESYLNKVNNLYSPEDLRNLQRGILMNAINLAESGCQIFYCTCSYQIEQNQAIIKYVLDFGDVEIMDIELPLSDYYEKVNINGKNSLIFGQNFNCSGLFVCKLKKK